MRSDVRVVPGPPLIQKVGRRSEALVVLSVLLGAIAQLGERVLCKHEVVGSIPSGSTISCILMRDAVEMVGGEALQA